MSGESLYINQVPSYIINRFNELSMCKFGYRRGSKKKAIIEAIKEWIEREDHRSKFRK